MCFILDIVLNHIRPVHSMKDLLEVKPFNDPKYLHLLNITGMTFDKYLGTHSSCFRLSGMQKRVATGLSQSRRLVRVPNAR